MPEEYPQQVRFCLDDPHEYEAREALAAEIINDDVISAEDVGAYFVAFHSRMDEYKNESAKGLPWDRMLEWRSAIERIIPLVTEAGFAGFESRLPPTVAAAIYTWLSVGAYRESSGSGLIKRLSTEWRTRQLIADALDRQAQRTLAAGPGQEGIRRFAVCYEQCVRSDRKPRLERILAMHAKEEATSQWREEWDALEACYEQGEIDHAGWTLAKEDMLARHP